MNFFGHRLTSQTAEFCYARLAIIVFQLTFAQGNARDNALIIQAASGFP